MNYRAEIDGLRAIAVLAVVIFHINPSYMQGGFVGVDIFFVISGFLITSIIKKQLNEDKFRFIDFYTRRVKRLLPLFFAIVAFVLIAGYFILLPNPYKILSGDVIAANFFVANFKAIIGGNYFESDKIKPLLHLWSLAVEEQFYFVFPLLYFLLHKFFKKYIVWIIALFAFISLGLAEYMSSQDKYATYSYFLLPTRMWELMAGSLLAITMPNPIKKHNTLISIVGIVMVMVSCYIISENSVFPGFITLLPIAGTLLLILAGKHGVGVLLSHKSFRFIGSISYSMYVWHWPILMFFKSIYPKYEFDIVSAVVFLAVLIIISFLSKKYIEDYFRYKNTPNRRKVFLYYLFIPSLITLLFSAYIYYQKGLPSRYNIDTKLNVTATKKCIGLTTGCYITKNKSEDSYVILLGDSHAEHFGNLFGMWFDDKNISLKQYVAGGCNFYSKDFYSTGCENVKDELAKELGRGSKPKVILIAKRVDDHYKDEKFITEFVSFIEYLTSQGHKIVLIKQVPKVKSSDFLNRWMQARRYGITSYEDNENEIDLGYSLGNSAVYSKLKESKNVLFLDFEKLLIVNDRIRKYDEDGLPLYFNSNHITAHGAEWIYSQIKDNQKYSWLIDLIEREINYPNR